MRNDPGQMSDGSTSKGAVAQRFFITAVQARKSASGNYYVQILTGTKTKGSSDLTSVQGHCKLRYADAS